MHYIPIDFNEVMPGFTDRLSNWGFPNYDFLHVLPEEMHDELLKAIPKYVIEKKKTNPNFSLYIDFIDDNDDGFAKKAIVVGSGVPGPYIYVELETCEDYDEIEDYFDDYDASFLGITEGASDFRFDNLGSDNMCYEVGDYHHIITGMYAKIENNQDAKPLLERI